jgi:hypothetical protein
MQWPVHNNVTALQVAATNCNENAKGDLKRQTLERV